jgi:hypothetical protein
MPQQLSQHQAALFSSWQSLQSQAVFCTAAQASLASFHELLTTTNGVCFENNSRHHSFLPFDEFLELHEWAQYPIAAQR